MLTTTAAERNSTTGEVYVAIVPKVVANNPLVSNIPVASHVFS